MAHVDRAIFKSSVDRDYVPLVEKLEDTQSTLEQLRHKIDFQSDVLDTIQRTLQHISNKVDLLGSVVC